MANTMCSGRRKTTLVQPYFYCPYNGTVEEQGKRWCKIHAPSSVAKRRKEQDKRLRAADALVARQRRMAQRAEAVRIVMAYIEWSGYPKATAEPEVFAADLYPEPKEAE